VRCVSASTDLLTHTHTEERETDKEES